MSSDARRWATAHGREVQQLVDMGFPEADAVEALYRTRNMEQAAELLVGGAALDDEPPLAGRSAVGGKAGSQHLAAPSADGGKPRRPSSAGSSSADASPYALGDAVRVKSKTRGWVEASVEKVDHNRRGECIIYVSFTNNNKLASRWLPAAAAYVRPAADASPGIGGAPSRSRSGNLDERSRGGAAGGAAGGALAASASAPPARAAEEEAPPPPPPPANDEPPRQQQQQQHKPVAPPKELEAVALEAGMFVDVRDTVGKWLEAEVVKVAGSEVFVHFLRWAAKWDEWIDREKEAFRFAPFHLYSAGSDVTAYDKGDKVFVYPPTLMPRQWVEGQVRRKDGPQLQVQFEVRKRKFQYWFHVESDEIAGKDGPDEEADSERSADGKWFRGQYIEVLDTVQKWLPASVVRVSGKRIFVHYENWSSRWDEWLDTVQDRWRLRALGDAIEPTREEKLKREEEARFRADLLEKHGFQVVDSDKDGNCLFRSVAHQIYNDPERHAEVRAACYDHMERDREFFGMYVGEDFDEYLARQRRANEWGDHVEIVAMREMYNCNVEVYDKDSVRAPKPLGLANEAYRVPVIRLSYHGSNHYNSVVDPRAPPPLGDGHDSAVQLRDLRLAELRKEEELAAERARRSARAADPAAEDTVPPLQSSPGSSSSLTDQRQQQYRERSLSRQRASDLMRPVDPKAVKLTAADFDGVWERHSRDGGAVEREDAVPLVRSLLELLYDSKRRQREADGEEIESLQKRYDDVKTDVARLARDLVMANRDAVPASSDRLDKAASREHVLRKMAGSVEWAFNK